MGFIRNTQLRAIGLLVTFQRHFIQLKMSPHAQLFSGFERLQSKLDLSRPSVSKKYVTGHRISYTNAFPLNG